MIATRRSRARHAALWVLLSLPLSACGGFVDNLLEVDAPSRVIGGTLAIPGNAALLVSSAIADLECALAFYVLSSALLGDELVDAQLAAATWDYDRRGFADGQGAYATNTCSSTGNIFGVYRPVATARWTADNVVTLLDGWSDAEVADRQSLLARALAYDGYAHVLLGEGFCTAAVDGGPELTSAQILQRAEERFTRAIQMAQESNQPDILNMSLVGRARVRLDLNRAAEAASDAAQVPTAFVQNASYTTASARSGNHVFRWNNRFFWASVDPKYQKLTVDGVPDPRVPVDSSGLRGADAFTLVWRQGKYASETSPIPIATGIEARLIEAEAAGGQAAVDIINTLRARHDLPAYTGSASAEAVRALIIDERRRELFLDGHHIHDIIRYQLPLTPAAGTSYPLKGGTYGTTTCLLLPRIERDNNPSLQGT